MGFESMGSQETTENLNNKNQAENNIDINDYESTLQAQKQAIRAEESQDIDNDPEHILLALNDTDKNSSILDTYDTFMDIGEDMKKNIEYCIDNGIIQNFDYPYTNKQGESNPIHFKVCGDKKTVEFGNETIGKIGTMEMTNSNPQQWNIKCLNVFDDVIDSKKCYQDVGECAEACVDLCIK